MEESKIKEIVKEKYAKSTTTGLCCCKGGCDKISSEIGYSEEERSAVPEANLGLGCGNPTRLIELKEGDVVVDLGSGAGMDAFIAAKKVGATGKIIGIDVTEEMIAKAKENAEKYSFTNCEFILADIEDIPLESNTADVILSNCVINLAPSKEKVFSEAFRILKPGGTLCVSDIVLLEELTPEQRSDPELIASCVGGALLKDHYISIIEHAGFVIKKMDEDKDISKKQYEGKNLESLKVVAKKPE